MEKLTIEKDIKAFGITVATFPAGIEEAFAELMKATGDNDIARDYYGVSCMEDNKMIYKALAAEKNEGEAKEFNYDTYTIENGEYYFERLKNWRSKTECIKDIFEEMMKDEHVNRMKPAVEWYKNDDEMLCMLRAL